MDTSALEKYAASARTALRQGVQNRLYLLGLTPQNLAPADADAVGGRLFSAAEKDQRQKVMKRVEALGNGDYRAGYDVFVERAASTWFNRLAALRYMEVHDFLPSHTRVLSAPDGTFAPQCLREADSLGLPGLAPERALALMDAHDDEALLRAVIVAQCEQLAEALPQVFGGAADDEPVLPDGLLRADGPVAGMVLDLPDELWADVEVLGWLYQFYIAERKDEVFAGFKKGKKAGPAELGPATQLFTPDWIVDYMVQNSLGRLWMLNNPGSLLVEKMPYYIAPEGDPGDFLKVSSPEEITVCDPACGSGHILVAAFRLLAQMYLERGYRPSDVPELILTKNLAGLEMDPRAAQFAELQLAMVAREYDRRFLTRGVRPDVRVLRPVEFEDGGLPVGCALEKNKALLDALSHLDQCGSLLAPTEGDLADLREALAACPEDLAGVHARGKLGEALASCEALARRFDCVIANPPYMGSSNFDKWTSDWVKKNYPDVKSDLFSAFIVRNMDFAKPHGEVGMMTPFVWMFIGSYEKLRNKLIDEKALTSLIQLEYSGFAGATVPICTFTFHNGILDGARGGYVRLSDFVGSDVQGPKALEAIQNPACGWFYRTDASTFKDIPGTPIAYWASEAMRRAFNLGSVAQRIPVKKGLDTGDNDKYLRLWYEVPYSSIGRQYDSSHSFSLDNKKWAPHDKGGDFRRWYGNNDWVINWENEGESLRSSKANLRSPQHYFHKSITWSSLTSGHPAFRYSDQGAIFNTAGSAMFPGESELFLLLAYMNSSVVDSSLELLSPTLNFSAGPVGSVPDISTHARETDARNLACESTQLSRKDDSGLETSWDFKRHPLV